MLEIEGDFSDLYTEEAAKKWRRFLKPYFQPI